MEFDAGMRTVGHEMPTAAKKILACDGTQGVPVA
jgi:hypothetical protein